MSAATAVVERQGIVQWAAQTYGVDAGKVIGILNATCFSQGKGEDPASDAEVASLMIVARQYGLNPFLRELFAFRDKKGGIVPVVGVDGWSRIINDKQELDGIEFRQPEEEVPSWIECVIYRKDREHPTIVRERMAECKRETGPWKSHPSRMLRHKALIQCARIAFGFAGIFDEDEAARIIDAEVIEQPKLERSATASLKAALADPNTAAQGEAASHSAGEAASDPSTDPSLQSSDGPGTSVAADQKDPKAKQAGTPKIRKQFIERMDAAKDLDALDLLSDETRGFVWGKSDETEIVSALSRNVGRLNKD